MKKLNLGCGPYKVNGFINIDRNPRQKPDVIRDVRKGLPFDSNSVEEIRAYHFLEHFDCDEFLFVLEECYRVLVDKGTMEIRVPLDYTGDIDHKMVFTETSFNMLFLADGGGDYFDSDMKWELLSKSTNKERNGLSSLNIFMRKIK